MREHVRAMVARAVEAGMPRERAEELCRNVAAGIPELVHRAVAHRVERFGWAPVTDAVVYAIALAADEEIAECVEAIADGARQRRALADQLEMTDVAIRTWSRVWRAKIDRALAANRPEAMRRLLEELLGDEPGRLRSRPGEMAVTTGEVADGSPRG